MDVSTTPIAERIARVLAGERLSANAQGEEEAAGAHVDAVWREHLPEALAVLRTLREPDRAMADAGDVAIWEKMVRAAIEGSKPQTVVL